MNIKECQVTSNMQYCITDTTKFAKQKQISYEKLYAASTKLY